MGLQIDPKTVIPCVRRRLCRLLPSLDILSTTLPVFSTGSRCGRYSVIAPIMLCTHRFTSDARAFMLLREASLDSMPDTPRRAHREHGSMFEFHFQALPLHSSTRRATEKTSRHHLRLTTSPPRHHTAKRGRSFSAVVNSASNIKRNVKPQATMQNAKFCSMAEQERALPGHVFGDNSWHSPDQLQWLLHDGLWAHTACCFPLNDQSV